MLRRFSLSFILTTLIVTGLTLVALAISAAVTRVAYGHDEFTEVKLCSDLTHAAEEHSDVLVPLFESLQIHVGSNLGYQLFGADERRRAVFKGCMIDLTGTIRGSITAVCKENPDATIAEVGVPLTDGLVAFCRMAAEDSVK